MIQSQFRGTVAKRCWRSTILSTKMIQRQWRMFAFRKRRQRSVMIIQALWRAKSRQSRFKHMLLSAISIQACVRRSRTVDVYQKTRGATIIIQAYWRRYFARHNFELDILEIVISQSLVRRKLAQTEVYKRRLSIQKLQNFARCWHSSKKLSLLRCQREDYLLRQSSATLLQVSWH